MATVLDYILLKGTQMKTNVDTVLVVDDEEDIRELLQLTLHKMNLQVFCASTISSAKDLLETHKFNLCLADMRLPDGDGLDLIYYAQQKYPYMPIAMITAYGTMDLAIKALKSGAFDFITKPIDLNNLRNVIKTALQVSVNQELESSEYQLLGDSDLINSLREQIKKLARTQAPIHIYGPSGSGKELVARLIHSFSPRSKKPFIAINCGAIPRELMESEFFGHKKGSFTGATHDKEGLFQAAKGGSLFLDEIGELPLDMQVKLLRAIQENSVRPVGATKEVGTDVRILSATNQDLRKAISIGMFREDLFYRINVIQVDVPGLHQHPEDIPSLATHIVKKISRVNSIEDLKLSTTALNTLQNYSFPGNVRELENILERAVALCDDKLIQPQDLHLPAALANDEVTDLETYILETEKHMILKALRKSGGDKSMAAQILGLTPRALRYRMQKLKINDKDI